MANIDSLLEGLTTLDDAERVAVLRQLFEQRHPDERNGLRFRWMLCRSTELHDIGTDWERSLDLDGRWSIEAVAYPIGADWSADLSEQGACEACGIEVLSTAKLARCPRCDSECRLT